MADGTANRRTWVPAAPRGVNDDLSVGHTVHIETEVWR
jgi:hypothetical protein